MTTLWNDFETYNGVKDIKAGTYEYTRTCEVLIGTYAFDDDPVQLWDKDGGEPMPRDLADALRDPEVDLIAHHAMFDRNVIREALGVDTDITRWRCTMVQRQRVIRSWGSVATVPN